MTLSHWRITILIIQFAGLTVFGQQHSISGKITDSNGKPVEMVGIGIEGSDMVTITNSAGDYRISDLTNGDYVVEIIFPNGETDYQNVSIDNLDAIFNYQIRSGVSLETIEIFGDRNKEQRRIEQITRFPVNVKDQLQSISIVSEKLIEDQGVLTVTDAVKNVPGVTQFASYGGIRESMSIRGYRGTPVLKNGVRMDSDFRTGATVSDMAGVESIQIIRGSAALTQGIGDGLGSAGGVINVVTKTPRFTDAAEISLRSGSWWKSRLQYDAQRAFGEEKNVGVRIAGAFQTGNSYRDKISGRRAYVTPSLAWRPDDKTEVVVEMDYLNDSSTPDRGTVNLASDDIEALYDMGSKFLGFNDDKQKTEVTTMSGTVTRKLAEKIDARVGYFGSFYESDMTGATIGLFRDEDGTPVYNKRIRGLGRSFRNDRNSTIQVDLMGKNMEFGSIKWSWQLGYDYTQNRTETSAAAGIKQLDIIDVFQNIDNPNSYNFSNWDHSKMELGEATITRSHYYGFVTQHHIGITDYVKLAGGMRWSYSIEQSESAVDPFIGLMVSPIENINLFGSYTTNSSLRTAANPLRDGGTVGISRTHQYEFGVKTNWLKDRLRANVVYYDMNNKNLAFEYYDENQTATGLYGLGGNLRRKGVELELAGRPLNQLEVMLGWAYMDVYYEDSPAFIDGSRPINAPKNTGNAYVNYRFPDDVLKGFSIGAGIYYVGERPVNDHTKVETSHDTIPGLKYFDMPSYTTLNVQMGYKLNKFDFRLFLNNITDAIGYNSYYRGGYINQIDPFNVSVQVNYKIY